LRSAANSSGGWGYYRGKSSRIEPTCWALFALSAGGQGERETHRRFLLACQRDSGLLVEQTALPVNFAFNALALIAMLRYRAEFGDAPLRRLHDALVKHKGEGAGPSPIFRQNNALQGWSWVEGTFSWLEPTSFGLLALKIARAAGLQSSEADARIDEAERLLIDRCCRNGGWNYGNANAFGKDLIPHLPTTALALLAMQNRRDVAEVQKSLAYLEAQWPKESSTIGLGLTTICLRRHAKETEQVTRRLGDHMPIAESLGNLHALAVAHCAMLPPDQHDVFTV